MSDVPDLAVRRHPPIRDQIATTLRNAIINQDFAPGQVLVERELCERTGASRPSVREALRQLETEGLVESRNGRGTVVRVLTAQETENVYEVRADLEGLAARLFCERAIESEREALQDAVRRLDDATHGGLGRNSEILAAQRAFYAVLFAGTRNPVLEQLVQGLMSRVAQLRATTLSAPGRAEQSLAEFHEIAAAIDARDAARAGALAAEHVERAAAAMRTVRPAE
ncbi:GntR family transcriptional regulator [Microbacterium sp. UBA3394]|uniref:GntR family transcriptional regulator n=1 Tax=Microbacterium sp. UBA3394 TaxID=1946945 RepID=UPI00257983D0|nr:GntR family transcriptional regulator [Microbacterium sp. UBA3394]|tara:strand:- start:955 stop:1632 length:678 start_codon:yes stop_codon:yes gene_type:complete